MYIILMNYNKEYIGYKQIVSISRKLLTNIEYGDFYATLT